MKYNLLSLKIKKYRQIERLTQEELAKKLNVSTGTVKFYETGLRFPSAKIKNKLCDIFHISIDELESRTEQEELKKLILSIIKSYELSLEEQNNIISLLDKFWRKCFQYMLIVNSNSNILLTNEILHLFVIQNKKSSSKYINVDKEQLKAINGTDTTDTIINITAIIIDNIIKFFDDYRRNFFFAERKGKILLQYQSYFVLEICMSNIDFIQHAISEINLSMSNIKYLVPLIETISLNLQEDIKHPRRFIELPSYMKHETQKYIGLYINNDEMVPKYEKENVVIIQLQEIFENHQDVLVSINNELPIIRRVILNKDGIILQPLNANYYPQFFSKSDIKLQNVKVLGIVKQLIININDISY